jgi:hypothetical protein
MNSFTGIDRASSRLPAADFSRERAAALGRAVLLESRAPSDTGEGYKWTRPPTRESVRSR